MRPRGEPLFQFDRRKRAQLNGNSLPSKIVGIDEAGRGPWAGPVVACAAILPADFFHPELSDSKMIAPKKRTKICEVLQTKTFWGLGIVEAETIDSMNIAHATHMAMQRALVHLLRKHPDVVPNLILVDGISIPPLGPFMQESVIKGDRLSASIAAASIMAKVIRDSIMEKLDRQYPSYGFAKHKGYGTKFHRQKLLEHGPSSIHRKSFSPVRLSLRNKMACLPIQDK